MSEQSGSEGNDTDEQSPSVTGSQDPAGDRESAPGQGEMGLPALKEHWKEPSYTPSGAAPSSPSTSGMRGVQAPPAAEGPWFPAGPADGATQELSRVAKDADEQAPEV